MIRLRFVWQGLLRRWGSAALSISVGALALSALMLIMWAQSAVPEAVKARIAETDMVVGPKSSGLDLALCCALHLTPAAGLLDPAEVDARLNEADIAHFIKTQVPIAMGDNFKGRRILWTTPDIIPFYNAELSEGRKWSGALEVVAGAEAARALNLNVGDHLQSSHGLTEDGDHHESTYVVTGILKPTGGILDHLLLADVSSIAAVHNDGHGHDHAHAPAPLRVNAVLVRFTSPIAQASVPTLISRSDTLTAASPRFELAKLMALIRPLIDLGTVLATLIGAVAALILMLTLVQGLNRRARELSLLRFLGMSRRDLAWLSFAEAIIITHIAFIAGLGLTVAGMVLTSQSLSAYGLNVTNGLPANLVLTLYGFMWVISGLAVIAPVTRLSLSRDDEGFRA